MGTTFLRILSLCLVPRLSLRRGRLRRFGEIVNKHKVHRASRADFCQKSLEEGAFARVCAHTCVCAHGYVCVHAEVTAVNSHLFWKHLFT